MSRARDDARRNARRAFATTRADGTPVAARIVAYSDGCVEGLLDTGDVFTSMFTTDHSEADHTPWLKAPFSYERFNELAYVEDYDYGYSEVSA